MVAFGERHEGTLAGCHRRIGSCICQCEDCKIRALRPELGNARRSDMNQFYYDAVTKMEQMDVDDEYIQGWQCGFLQNPKREEQRLTEAYEAGYSDGEEKSTDNIGNWAKG